MLVLWQHKKGISVKDLGAQLDLDSGTLSPLLKRLQGQDLLTRDRHSDDERVVIIKLTEQGCQLQKSAEHIPAKMFAITGLTPDNLKDLTSELDRLIENISS